MLTKVTGCRTSMKIIITFKTLGLVVSERKILICFHCTTYIKFTRHAAGL